MWLETEVDFERGGVGKGAAVDLPAHRGAFGDSLACVGLLTHIRVVECVEKNIPAEEAVERLLQLIERCEAAG